MSGRWTSSSTAPIWTQCARRGRIPMALAYDGGGGAAANAQPLSAGCGTDCGPAGECPLVLVVDADRALFGLIQEWLAAAGCRVMPEPAHARASGRVRAV